jgi:hypothetical protein
MHKNIQNSNFLMYCTSLNASLLVWCLTAHLHKLESQAAWLIKKLSNYLYNKVNETDQPRLSQKIPKFNTC